MSRQYCIIVNCGATAAGACDSEMLVNKSTPNNAEKLDRLRHNADVVQVTEVESKPNKREWFHLQIQRTCYSNAITYAY